MYHRTVLSFGNHLGPTSMTNPLYATFSFQMIDQPSERVLLSMLHRNAAQAPALIESLQQALP